MILPQKRLKVTYSTTRALRRLDDDGPGLRQESSKAQAPHGLPEKRAIVESAKAFSEKALRSKI